MYKTLLVANALLSLALLFRYFTKPRPSEFHPAGPYIAFHGVLFTILPIVEFFVGSSFITQFYYFAPSESAKIVLLLGSLSVAIGLLWAQEHRYNLAHDLWICIMFFGIGALFVLIAGVIFPVAAGAFFESIRSKPYWAD